MERTARGPREGAVGDPGALRGVPQGPPGARRRRARSTSRSRRPAGSTTSSSWRADVPRRPRAQGVAAAATSGPSTRPRTARPGATTSTTPTSRRGSGPATPASRAAQGAARVRERPAHPAELQVAMTSLERHPQGLAPGRAGRRRALRDASRSTGISDDTSFLEMLDVVNERLTDEGREPIAFDHDCREGICGTCSLMINGQAHGPQRGTATCQLHMRKFPDGDTDHRRAVAGRRPSRSSRT